MVGTNGVLDVLTRLQFVNPHAPVSDVLQLTIDELGCCPVAVERAIQWLGLDRTQSAGRLRRTEIMQLARSISRFWNAALAVPQGAPQSA